MNLLCAIKHNWKEFPYKSFFDEGARCCIRCGRSELKSQENGFTHRSGLDGYLNMLEYVNSKYNETKQPALFPRGTNSLLTLIVGGKK